MTNNSQIIQQYNYISYTFRYQIIIKMDNVPETTSMNINDK